MLMLLMLPMRHAPSAPIALPAANLDAARGMRIPLPFFET